MTVAGIICEYNPFHRGHQYHIRETKKNADACLCLMSGHFVQRGEPASANKFVRAESAVAGGADLVLELPTVFAVRSAETFAFGAVSLLEQTGIVSSLSFGSETACTEELNKAGIFFAKETDSFKERFGMELKKGLSFPAARANAVQNESFGFLLSRPNDLLGVEYSKAIHRIGSGIRLSPVLRHQAGHGDAQASGRFCSAAFLRNNPEQLEAFSPAASLLRAGGFPIDTEIFQTLLMAHLRTIRTEQLALAADCTEGLEYRIRSAAMHAETFDEMISEIHTKRYTKTRIQRVILNSYLGITKEDYQPEYFRVLAANQTGAEMLRRIKKAGNLPIITNLSKQKTASKMLNIDINAGNIYSLFQRKNRRGGMDYTVSPRFFSDK